MASMQELVRLMRVLRGPRGCPWDREQTLADFRKHFKNESAEVLEALRKEDWENLREELGDVLWHIIFMSEIAEDEGLFALDDVMEGLKEKMVRRHPHVFGAGRRLKTSADVMREYRKIKAKEKRR